MKFNFKEDKMPFDGYDFGGRSYAKEIKDLNPSQGKNGYGIIGDFLSKKEDVELEEGHLYLSVSRGSDKEITHLFTIKEDKPVLIKQSEAQKGAIRTLWNSMESFLDERPKKSPQQLLNFLLEQESDRKTLKELAFLIMQL